MEALALIGGILAFIQTGDRLVTLLDQIRPLAEAPNEINSLINEITQLNTVFRDFETALEDVSSNSIPSHHERYANMAQTVEEGNNTLLKLQSLISDVFLKSQGRHSDGKSKVPRVNRISWARKREDVQRLRQQLRDVRLTMLVQLGSLEV